MAYRITVFLIVISFASSTSAQNQINSGKGLYVMVPPESVVVVAASQPDSPIQIEDSKLLNSIDGNRRAAFQYQIRNRGTKPIQSVSIYALDSAATGGGPLYNGHRLSKPLRPGKKILLGEKSVEIVKLTAELQNKLRLTSGVRVVLVLLVERVEYTDGSVFDGRKTVNALRDYFVDINSAKIESKADPYRTALAPLKPNSP